MGEAGREEYKIQSFDAETQQLLKTALKGELGNAGEPGRSCREGAEPQGQGMPKPPSPFTS